MQLVPFETIEARARERVGGVQALADRLPAPRPAAALRATPDDRYLSEMTRRIFRAGLSHAMVDARWPAFEEVFFGFDPPRIAAMPDEALEALLGDRRLIRHWGKLKAVRANAAAVLALARDRGGVGAYLADWPADDVVDLWRDLARRFSQLGGQSGPYFLRMVGRDTFILTDSVIRGLEHWDAVAGRPRTRADREQVQAVFAAWHRSSSRPLCQLSMIVALSVD